MDLEEIASATWEYESRTLDDGTPGDPSTYLEEIAEAVWEYETRTMTSASGLPAGVKTLLMGAG